MSLDLLKMGSSSTIRLAPLTIGGATQLSSSVQSHDPSQLTDEVLITSLSSSNGAELSELFKRYARLVRSVGHKVLRVKFEAEDLVQETFLYIHRKHSLFDPSKGCGRSWILQVAYTQAFLRRRVLKSQGFYLPGSSDRRSDHDCVTQAAQDYDCSVEGLFGRNGWKKIVDELTVDQRATLRLHFFEGYTFPEIAEKLGQSYANIRNHHYRGLERLRRHLVENAPNRR
jgi:RNA polymerase sigma-70 factor, ECF subfamily